MHQYISAVILSVLSATAVAKGKWEAGVAVGAGMGRAPVTINTTEPGFFPSRYKFTYKAGGPVGGLNVGYVLQHKQFMYGLNIAGYKDFYKIGNKGHKSDLLSGVHISADNEVKRKYTLEFSGKFGRIFAQDIKIYGKLGILRSPFVEQYREDADDARGKTVGWGGVVGLGVQKEFETISVGLAYDYHYYEKIGTTLRYGAASEITNKSRFRPQYHNLFLTLSKSF